MRAEKQACKQLQHYKAKLFEPASINGLYNLEPAYYVYTLMKIEMGISTLLHSTNTVSLNKKLS